MTKLNLYGDDRTPAKGNYGVDIAMQRVDDLDRMAIKRIKLVGRSARALDAACATGGQALRMARAGANTIALDIEDYAESCRLAAQAFGVQNRLKFLHKDLKNYSLHKRHRPFDVIVCQRMIHYVPFAEAVKIVEGFKRALSGGGRLYISASGINSELGNNYPHKGVAIQNRHAPLASDIANKHAIHGAICLYDEADMDLLLRTAGLKVVTLFPSPFGNIKAVASL